jgi:hypothetical protein
MAVLELLARATEAWVVAAGNGHLVNRSSRIVDGVWRRGAAGKPVCMDVAGGWRYQFNEPLMSRVGILVTRMNAAQVVVCLRAGADGRP